MNDVAIIGISGVFPKADNIKQFWENLSEGKECSEVLSDEELEKVKEQNPEITDFSNYVKRVYVLNHSDRFEPEFFGYSKREIEMTDPQQRLFLQCSFEAFEDAGYNPDKVTDIVGVFGGESFNTYLFNNLYSHKEYFNSGTSKTLVLHSNSGDYLTTRVSYKLNLTGPSVSVQTACSTSLVAVHEACESLLNYECDMALAGGSSVLYPEREGYIYEEGGIISKSGHCRPFDKECDGTVFGSGTGVVLLKRLDEAVKDKDHIYAVIKGTAIDNDGASKVGYAAPSIPGQKTVILNALAQSEVNPEDISYIEAHGTGTKVGDPIEITALTNAFREYTDKKRYCGIGSVKSNIGHLNAAAGVASLIKTALMLEHKTLVPSIHFKEINPLIDIQNTPFYVCSEKKEWIQDKGIRYAGVSSFGMGGTNAHVILSEAPEAEKNKEMDKTNIVILSARTQKSLFGNMEHLKHYLTEHKNVSLESVAYTLQSGRREHGLRAVIPYKGIEELLNHLEKKDFAIEKAGMGEMHPVFMFTGQGSQYLNMAKSLREKSSIFQKYFDICRKLFLEKTEIDIYEMLYHVNNQELIGETRNTQIILFSLEYSLAKLLMEFGIVPKAMIGHSIGEYVAACIAGVFTLEDAVLMVSERGRLMEEAERGSMYAVNIILKQEQIGDQLEIAAVNTMDSCVISGRDDVIENYVKVLGQDGVTCKKLRTSHAFHSTMMTGAAEKFLEVVKKVPMHKAQILYISNITGDFIKEEQICNPEYWAKHLCKTVQFSKGLETLIAKENKLFIEVGPGNTLCNFVCGLKNDSVKTVSLLPHPKDKTDDYYYWLKNMGQLWAMGQQVNWGSLYEKIPYKVSLPTYDFDTVSCFIEPKETKVHSNDLKEEAEDIFSVENNSELARENLSCDYKEPVTQLQKSVEEIWEEVLGISNIGIYDNFFELGGNSLIVTQIVSRIKDKYMIEVNLDYLFENPTIAVLSAYIETQLQSKIENMTEEEALAMLTSMDDN